MILSGARNTTHPPDARMILATTLGNALPKYALEFTALDNDFHDDFALDRCEDPANLIQRNLIDEDFLLSRYERLFKYPNTQMPKYYLVPWMTVPSTRPTPTSFSPVDNLYRLKVEFAGALASSVSGSRKLRLTTSDPDIGAAWRASSQQLSATPNELTVNPITNLCDEIVEIAINPGSYSDAVEYIQIREVNPDNTDGDIVAKVRLLFIEVLAHRVFPIMVTEAGDYWDLDRILSAGDAPVALESDPGVANKSIIDETDRFGFRQIGVTLSVAGTNIDLYDKDNNSLFLDTNSAPITFQIKKTDIVGRDGIPIGEPSRKSQFEYHLMRHLFEKAAYLMDDNSNKKSKYAATYIFFTKLPFEGTLGVSYQGLEVRPEINLFRKISNTEVRRIIPPNATVFNWERAIANFPITATQWDYHTLTHETIHSLLANHSFDEEVDVNPIFGKSKLFLEDYAAAFSWFSLCLEGDYDRKAVYRSSSKRIKIDNFLTTATGTLFDDIAHQGMENAISSFIDTKIFNGTARPSQWTMAELIPSSKKTNVTDLYVWATLNDTVKFQKHKTPSVMDYTILGPQWVIDSVTGEPRSPRLKTELNRFQWELVRASVRRLNELVYQA